MYLEDFLEGLVRGLTYRYMEHKEDEYPISLQIFGNKEDDFKKAIELTDLSGFSFIDINMGCPTKKVVRNNGGAGLLSDTDKMVMEQYFLLFTADMQATYIEELQIGRLLLR